MMRLLQCLDPGIRDFLTGHKVTTGRRSQLAEHHRQTACPTGSRKLRCPAHSRPRFEFQHNLKKLTFGILILHPTRNRREDYEPMAEALRQAVTTVQPGQVLHVYAKE
jgi:hypothetical protein